jgi:putative endonuclease
MAGGSALRRVACHVKDFIAHARARLSGKRAHLTLGDLGEDLAVNALTEKGYRVVARNHKIYGHEIDVIAMDGDTLVFVEVKTRSNRDYGKPLASIGPTRVKRLRKAAELYLVKEKIKGVSVRFDAVSVEIFGEKPVVEVVRNAF